MRKKATVLRIVLSAIPLLLFILFLLPLPFGFTSAHEVYVLDQETIESALAAESSNPFSAYHGNEYEFYFWGFISFVAFSTILFASVFHLFEKQLDPLLFFLKRIAHPLVRLTVGTTLVVFGWYGVLYGPELPLAELFGGAAGILQALLIILGVAVFAGIYARAAAFIAILVYFSAVAAGDWDVFSYVNHLGAYLFLGLMGSGEWALDSRWHAGRLLSALHSFLEKLRPLAFPLLRMSFGLAIMLAAIYAKYVHSELAEQVVIQYDLTRFFPFDPLFVVLGAFIIEFLAGLMMFVGVAVRWTALFLAFWLTVGHIFTEEEWWVHLILYGIALAIFCHGYDHWSLEGRYLRRNGREPVL